MEKNLEQLRDEKCIPIVRSIMEEMGNGLINSENNQTVLALKSISLMLDSDLTISTEVSYIPQLILRLLSEMNNTFQSCELKEDDDERYGTIANKILSILSKANIRLDDCSKEEIASDFEAVKVELNKLFAEENLTRLELRHIKDMITDSFTTLNNTIQESLVNATQRAESKSFGIESMDDLTLKKLDEFLKS